MLEIALNNDISKKRADDGKEKVLHLSSVNDHRVLLYSVDPSLNYQKRDTDVATALECEGDKQADESVSKENVDNVKVENIIQGDTDRGISSPSESVDQSLSQTSYSMTLCFSHNSPKTLNSNEVNAKVANAQGNANENTDTVSGAAYQCRGKLRGERRRGQGSWKFDGNRRQKGSKGKPPRSELSKEKLLKLREKERIAQKIRRLKRAEEKRSELLNGNGKREVSGKWSEMANDGSVNDLRTVEDIRENCSMPEPETTVNSSCLENLSTFPSVSQPVNDEKTLKARPSNSKLNYMFALGLQHNMKTEDRSRRFDSCREFTTDALNGPLARIPSQPMSDLEDRVLENGISPMHDENMIATGANGCDNLNQNWSEESSDSCEKANSSANSPKKARRDNLSKEELDKLREKERVAKRKQRARIRKVFPAEDPMATQSDESNSAIEEAESPKRQLLPQNGNISNSCNNSNDSTSQTLNETSTSDCGRGSNPCLEKDDSSLPGERTDLPTKSLEGKKVKFGRFYDRSLLTAEELESLRRREREYQRKRRARLREEKFKALGGMPQNKISSEKDAKPARPNDVENVNEDSSRKYETRMSKGISRPSLRFLEHSSVSYFENEHDGRKLIDYRGEPALSGKQERDCPENQASYSPKSELPIMFHKEFSPKECSLSQNDLETPLKVNEYEDYGKYINAERADRIESEENSSVPVPESDQGQKNSSEDREEDKAISRNGTEEHCFLKEPNMEFHVTNENSIDREMYKTISAKRRSPLTEALYASDYKILQENGYHSMTGEPEYDTRFYELPGNSRIYHSSLVGHCPPSSPMIKCVENTKKGDVSKERMFNVNGKEETFETNVDIRPCKRGMKTDTDSSSSQKWRNWKSGLTDSQLQRRRQSNREAQRRRRMRLRLMQMKSFQEQDQISFDEIMYKRFTPNKRMMVNEAIKAFNASKSKLKNMLERRQKVFMDAQIEKYKNEIDCNSPHNAAADVARKNRGCRIKVTPKRQVVVPSMGFPCSQGIVNEQLCDPGDNECFPQHQISPSYEPARLGHMDCSSIQYPGKSEKHFTPCLEDLSPPSYDDHLQNTSSRKRKQFCPRRLLSEAERRSHEGIQSVVIAQS